MKTFLALLLTSSALLLSGCAMKYSLPGVGGVKGEEICGFSECGPAPFGDTGLKPKAVGSKIGNAQPIALDFEGSSELIALGAIGRRFTLHKNERGIGRPCGSFFDEYDVYRTPFDAEDVKMTYGRKKEGDGSKHISAFRTSESVVRVADLNVGVSVSTTLSNLGIDNASPSITSDLKAFYDSVRDSNVSLQGFYYEARLTDEAIARVKNSRGKYSNCRQDLLQEQATHGLVVAASFVVISVNVEGQVDRDVGATLTGRLSAELLNSPAVDMLAAEARVRAELSRNVLRNTDFTIESGAFLISRVVAPLNSL